jgi:hypothetical protein
MTEELGALTTPVSSSRGETRAYHVPRLIAYGKLKTLTQGGSANAAETSEPPPPPGSNPDPTKRRL